MSLNNNIMDLKEALNIIVDKLISQNSIPVKIRIGLGLDQKDFLLLKNAILYLIAYYKGKEEIPKKLALAFVNISNYFFVSNDSPYSQKEIEKIEDAGMELSELGEKLFS